MKTVFPILKAENLSIGYKNKSETVCIKESINLTIESGKLIALAGKNGIGKSTFLKTITALLPPLKGTVLLNNKNISEYSAQHLAQQMSLVLTERLPQSNLTAYEITALGRSPYTNWIGTLSPEDKAKTEEAIQLSGISAFAHKKHYKISDGQLQKVLVARALAQDTPIIILDEPTTHLDLVHKVTLLQLLKKLTRETGKTILYSTHDLDLAVQLSDELIVFTPDEVAHNSPEILIQNGIFERLFEKDTVFFDKEKTKFVVR